MHQSSAICRQHRSLRQSPPLCRVTAFSVSGHQLPPNVDDMELGQAVAEGEWRIVAGQVECRELSQAYSAAFAATLRHGP